MVEHVEFGSEKIDKQRPCAMDFDGPSFELRLGGGWDVWDRHGQQALRMGMDLWLCRCYEAENEKPGFFRCALASKTNVTSVFDLHFVSIQLSDLFSNQISMQDRSNCRDRRHSRVVVETNKRSRVWGLYEKKGQCCVLYELINKMAEVDHCRIKWHYMNNRAHITQWLVDILFCRAAHAAQVPWGGHYRCTLTGPFDSSQKTGGEGFEYIPMKLGGLERRCHVWWTSTKYLNLENALAGFAMAARGIDDRYQAQVGMHES